MAATRAWSGAFCSCFEKQHARVSIRSAPQCHSYHRSGPVLEVSGVSCSALAPRILVKCRQLSFARGRDLNGRFRSFAAQEAGTSTLMAEEVEFTWKGEASEVFLTGDFFQWESRVALVKNFEGSFSVKKKLPAGKFAYKFIVDGEWKHSADLPTVPDGSGGFNNEVIVVDPSAEGVTPSSPVSLKAEAVVGGTESQKLKLESVPEPKPKAKTEPDASKPASKEKAVPDGPKPSSKEKAVPDGSKPTPKATAAKKAPAVKKSLEATMLEDVIPQLLTTLRKEGGLSDIDVTFEDNQLKTSFTKGDVPYCHWAFFADGTLEGAKGASLTSFGSPPGTVEPFLVDENKITPELVVFWIRKRLFAQKNSVRKLMNFGTEPAVSTSWPSILSHHLS